MSKSPRWSSPSKRGSGNQGSAMRTFTRGNKGPNECTRSQLCRIHELGSLQSHPHHSASPVHSYLPLVVALQKHVYLITTLLPGPPDDGNINSILPKELLLRIFSFLDIVSMCRSAQVCRDWHILALDGSNWQYVNLFSFQKDIKGPVVESLAKRCGGFLKHLNLSGCENVQDGALHCFASKCHFIEELNLQKCKRLTDATCHSLGRHCHRLRVLNLDGCGAITEHGIKSISEGCVALEELNISWCNNILDVGLEALARNCPSLLKIICKGCDGITDDGIQHLTSHCHNLRVLNVHSCSQLTDRTAENLSEGCHYLEGLCLSMCSQITDRSLQCLALGCHRLKDLEVAGCSQLTDSGFNSLAKNCHELERMDLEDCSMITDHTLTHLAAGCPNLEALSFSHCEQITNEGIRQLALGLAMQDRLRFLELDNCPHIEDVALEYLKECRTLERVELFDCQAITRYGIRRFKQYLPAVAVHAYFAPATPESTPASRRRGICRCCTVL